MQDFIKEIVIGICDEFGYSLEEFISHKKTKELSRIRIMTYYILHCDYNVSTSQIAQFFCRSRRPIQKINAITKHRLRVVKSEVDLYNKVRKNTLQQRK